MFADRPETSVVISCKWPPARIPNARRWCRTDARKKKVSQLVGPQNSRCKAFARADPNAVGMEVPRRARHASSAMNPIIPAAGTEWLAMPVRRRESGRD